MNTPMNTPELTDPHAPMMAHLPNVPQGVMKTPTPLTDAKIVVRHKPNGEPELVVHLEDARKVECELTETKAKLAEAEKRNTFLEKYTPKTNLGLIDNLDAAHREIAALRDAISDYLKHPSQDGRQPERAQKRQLLKSLVSNPDTSGYVRAESSRIYTKCPACGKDGLETPNTLCPICGGE